VKKIGIHVFTHIEKYQLIAIGILALIWLVYPDNKRLEPRIVFITVIFAAVALKKIIVKGNIDKM
jgi:hypothetical protein